MILDNLNSFQTVLHQEKCCSCGFRIYLIDFDKFLKKKECFQCDFWTFSEICLNLCGNFRSLTLDCEHG